MHKRCVAHNCQACNVGNSAKITKKVHTHINKQKMKQYKYFMKEQRSPKKQIDADIQRNTYNRIKFLKKNRTYLITFLTKKGKDKIVDFDTEYDKDRR